jgi:hypothetical protein
MGEKFEVRRYDRFTSLEAEPGSLGAAGYRAVRPGDCIVAFSRKDIYSIKQARRTKGWVYTSGSAPSCPAHPVQQGRPSADGPAGAVDQSG